MHLLSRIASPLVTPLTASTDGLLRLFRIRKGDEPPVTENVANIREANFSSQAQCACFSCRGCTARQRDWELSSSWRKVEGDQGIRAAPQSSYPV